MGAERLGAENNAFSSNFDGGDVDGSIVVGVDVSCGVGAGRTVGVPRRKRSRADVRGHSLYAVKELYRIDRSSRSCFIMPISLVAFADRCMSTMHNTNTKTSDIM